MGQKDQRTQKVHPFSRGLPAAKRTLILMREIVAEYDANPKPDDLIAFSTYIHAKRVLQKIEVTAIPLQQKDQEQ